MPEMNRPDYDTLELFIKTALERVASGKSNVPEASGDIMHPLCAWDKGNAQEFIPWIKLTLKA